MGKLFCQEALVRDWLDWIGHNPRPDHSGNKVVWPYGCYAWQTLTTGIRLEKEWPNALYRCLGSPAFTDDAIAAILGSICDQARHLIQWPTGNNWLTEECMGVFAAGSLFPEFKEAEGWRCTAIERLYKQLTDEVYPDGAEYELAAGYGNWVVRNMVLLMERARMNGFEDELPEDFLTLTEKMFDYLVSVSMPDGRMPGLNDSGNADVKGLLETGHGLFPHREDFLYIASRREKGIVPQKVSIGLPWSGHYVMRTGWDADALFMLFDSGPYGSGHQHEDKLHFVLNAYGKQLVLDPGSYSYDASRWRRYVITTPAHNTIMVDGMSQHRRGNRDTYVWPKPWVGDAPQGNDTVWVSGPDLDFARGTYRDGYGRPEEGAREDRRPERRAVEMFHAVTHTRRVLFLKPDYWVIVDTLSASDEADHVYESLFHLNADEAAMDEASKTVVTTDSDVANLAIVPMANDALSVEIVKGQDDPVQGWANRPWRPVPTAVYTQKGGGTTWLAYALYPTRPGQISSISSVTSFNTSDSALGLTVQLADGGSDTVLISQDPGQETAIGDYITDAEAAVIRMRTDSTEARAFLAGGTSLSQSGKPISTDL